MPHVPEKYEPELDKKKVLVLAVTFASEEDALLYEKAFTGHLERIARQIMLLQTLSGPIEISWEMIDDEDEEIPPE